MNSPVQLELAPVPAGTPGGGTRPTGEATDATDTAWLERMLDTVRDWQTAAEILQSIGRPVTEDNKRWLRDVASRAKYVLSGPGSPGYRHIKHSNLEECAHYREANFSQGKGMIKRGIKISRAAHEIFG